MSAGLIAERYARALVQILEELKDIPSHESFVNICDLAAGNAALGSFFANVSVRPDQKVKVIDSLASQFALSGTIHQFLKVLAHNRRLDLLPHLKDAVIKQVHRHLKIQPLLLKTAVAPTEHEISHLQDVMAKAMGQSVIVKSSVDESLLGGALVQVGSKVFDGSVRGQLERLRKQLVKE